MDKSIFLSRLSEVLQVSPENISEDFPLNPDNWDSLVHLGTIAIIDNLYNITVPAQELKDCTSVGQVLSLVERQLEKHT